MATAIAGMAGTAAMAGSGMRATRRRPTATLRPTPAITRPDATWAMAMAATAASMAATAVTAASTGETEAFTGRVAPMWAATTVAAFDSAADRADGMTND